MFTRLNRLEYWQRTMAIMFVAQLVSAIGFSQIFPFLPLYVQSLGARSSLSVEFLAGMVFSAQAITMMIASPLWGGVADRFGRKLMVQRAMFGGAVIICLMGFVRSAEELVILRAIQGTITGTVPAANALVAAAAPRQRTGYAMGVLQVGMWGGLAIGPLVGGLLADAVGYRWTFVVTGALLLVAGSLVHFGVQEIFDRQSARLSHNLSFLSDIRGILTAQGVTTAYSLRFLGGLGQMILVPIAPLFLQTLLPNSDHLNTYTGLVVGLASAATTTTGIYLGRLGDRVGHRRVLVVSALLAGVAYLPQSLVSEAWQLLLLQALTGAAAGGIIPSVSALLTNLTRPGDEGSVFGLDSSIFAGSRAVAPLMGSVVALWFNLRAAFLVAGGLYLLLSALALSLLPRPELIEPGVAD